MVNFDKFLIQNFRRKLLFIYFKVHFKNNYLWQIRNQ